MANIILHQIGNTAVGLNPANGYINATAMTTGNRERMGTGKDVHDWLRLSKTKEDLEQLSSVTGIPVTELYQLFEGAPVNGGGTWIHPRLAVCFGMWLSSELGLAVGNWVEEWRSQPQTQIVPKTALELAKEQVKLLESMAIKDAQLAVLEAGNERQAEAIAELFD